MNKVFRWILSVVGYGTYTLAVVVFLLWFLFPTDGFKVWLQNQLEKRNPSLTWKVKEFRLAWPFSVVAQDVQAGDREAGKPLLEIDEVKVRPDLKEIFEVPEKFPFIYNIRSLDGSISGSVSFLQNRGEVNCSGRIHDMQLGGLDEFWKRIGRSVSGKASGPFTYNGNVNDLFSGQFQADLAVKNGSMQLLQPILGLEQLDFNQAQSSMSTDKRTVTLSGGKVDSDLFSVDFSGTVALAADPLGSVLDVEGTFEPRPELLGNLKNPAVVKLIKDQLSDDKLTFKLSDTLMEPGIVFQGVSGVIDGVIQGSVK